MRALVIHDVQHHDLNGWLFACAASQEPASASDCSSRLQLTISHSTPSLDLPLAEWPSPSSWTAPTCVFPSRTVIVWFTDPALPGLLQPVIQVRGSDGLFMYLGAPAGMLLPLKWPLGLSRRQLSLKAPMVCHKAGASN